MDSKFICLAVWPLAALLIPVSFSSGQAEKVATKSEAIAPDAAAGKSLFERHCALCHGMDGSGGRGPNLHRSRLNHAPDDHALQSVISEGIPPEMPPAWFLSEEEVANLSAYVRQLGKIPAERLNGDAQRGAAVFSKSACAGCHIFSASGTAYGPDLTDLSNRRSASYVREAILAPAKHLPEGFLFVRATTASGKIVEGVRLNEDTFSIQVQDAAGNFHSFRKKELKELQKLRGQTPMPSYKNDLTANDLDDLVAYLFSVKASQ